MTQDKHSKPRSISMYPFEWEQVTQVAQRTGVRTLSAALRIIISEWADLQRDQQDQQKKVCAS